MKKLDFYLTPLLDQHYEEVLKFNEGLGIEAVELVPDFESYYMEFTDFGMIFLFSEGLLLDSIFLISDDMTNNNDDYKGKFSPYTGAMPQSLRWSINSKEVYNLAGEPDISGGGEVDIIEIPSWDKFVYQNATLHVQYNKSKKLEMITLGSLRLEEYLNS